MSSPFNLRLCSMSDQPPDQQLVALGEPQALNLPFQNGQPATLRLPLHVLDAVAFELELLVEIGISGESPLYRGSSRDEGCRINWLPRGAYSVDWIMPRLALPAGDYLVRVVLFARQQRHQQPLAETGVMVRVLGDMADSPQRAHWHLASECDVDLPSLSWQQGPDNWFYRHFDHAAHVIVDYMLDNSPLLSGKILDVGCGDGITDLGVFLRCQPELLVGIDPDRSYERLPSVLADNQLPLEQPARLRFTPDDANHVPFPDDYFDVVISWGSVEHIPGGYLQTLREIKRVLKPDGLLFIHPGLYYGNYGHHLGEFSSEPFFHLTKNEDEIRELVFSKDPNLMDRSGYQHVSQADFWRYYTELNPITVTDFERELRALDFDFFRAAIRTEDVIEYSHPALQNYPVQDLATLEFYLSAYNRKAPRPPGFEYQQ